MVSPEDILRKAENLYPAFLQAWIDGKGFFPRVIPANKELGTDIPTAIRQVQALRANSKEIVGYGYTIEWEEVRSRTHGKNLFPKRILISSQQDLLRAIRKEKEFATFEAAVNRLRSEFPELAAWGRGNTQALIEVSDDLDDLLEVVHCLLANPRPQVFARELPIQTDTKFVARHQRILRAWLDLVLPPHSIRADEDHFERRFGLRYVEPHLFLRFLDPTIQLEVGMPCEVLSVPLETLAAWPVRDAVIVMVENRVNLMTLPSVKRGIALGGLGMGAVVFRYLSWLATNALIYWGDMDVEGFEILSRLRTLFPHARSALMDAATLERCRDLAGSGTGRDQATSTPPLLTPSEASVFGWCLSVNGRIEQERIPQREIRLELDKTLALLRPSNSTEKTIEMKPAQLTVPAEPHGLTESKEGPK